MSIRFEVPFVRGKGRARFVRATGRAYTPDKTMEAMYAVRAAYVAAGGTKAPAGAEVSVHITAMRPLPKTAPKSIEDEPDIHRPDVDNLAKLVLDALNGTAWDDDAQVTDLVVGKCRRMRGAVPRTYVWIDWSTDEQ